MAEEEKVRDRKSERCYVCCASGDGLTEALERALKGREHVVMVRVNDELLEHLDMLVESGICKSRSCAATFMIREGIKANRELFARISEVAEQIASLRRKLRDLVSSPEQRESEEGREVSDDDDSGFPEGL
ncbi:TPA: hypothetical protein EYP12_03730 [Candidatus Bipolaricaulota bacterium]|nr:hypothetical protein [Candidatus Bipolaricaulota bacterium]